MHGADLVRLHLVDDQGVLRSFVRLERQPGRSRVNLGSSALPGFEARWAQRCHCRCCSIGAVCAQSAALAALSPHGRVHFADEADLRRVLTRVSFFRHRSDLDDVSVSLLHSLPLRF